MPVIVALLLATGSWSATAQAQGPARIEYAAPIEEDGGEIPPDGTWGTPGGACTRFEPCAIADFIASPGPHLHLVLLDGVYRGRRSMLRLPAGFGGRRWRWLTIRAENDGGVLIDAGRVGPALQVQGSFVQIEGIDVRSQIAPASVNAASSWETRVRDVILRRVVAYKDAIPCEVDPCSLGRDRATYAAATPPNSHVLIVVDADHVLLEDVAAFGRGRKVVEVYRSTNVTLRRVWARSEGNWPYLNSSNLKAVTCMYRSLDTLCENVLATVGGSRDTRIQPSSYRDTPQIMSTDGQPKLDARTGATLEDFVPEDRDPHDVGLRILGSILYELPGSKLVASHGLRVGASAPYPSKGMKGVEIDDVVVWLRSHSTGRRLALNDCDEGVRPGRMDGCDWRVGAGRLDAPLVYDGLTLRGGEGDRVGDDWIGGHDVDAAPVTEVGLDIYTPGGPGASICTRTVDGVPTDEPLWPWPMEGRIARATRRSHWEAADIEADLESLFAPVPPECRAD